MKINVKYNGGYPNLCRGKLIVEIDGVEWKFPDYCLVSGGNVWFGDNWEDHVESGPWYIEEWPEGFPKGLKEIVLERINEEIPHGCCGGCI